MYGSKCKECEKRMKKKSTPKYSQSKPKYTSSKVKSSKVSKGY